MRAPYVTTRRTVSNDSNASQPELARTDCSGCLQARVWASADALCDVTFYGYPPGRPQFKTALGTISVTPGTPATAVYEAPGVVVAEVVPTTPGPDAITISLAVLGTETGVMSVTPEDQ